MKLNKKKLKNLSSEKVLANAATPNVAGGFASDTPDCVPTNRQHCRTGVISCWNGRDCAFTNRMYLCD